MMSKIIHVTSAHPRNDIRIFQKMCISLAGRGLDVSLVCADGVGSVESGALPVIDVGMPDGRFIRMLSAPVKIFNEVRKSKGSVIHFHDPELLPIALLLRWLEFDVVYDAHEDVPRQILSKPWIPRLMRKPISWLFELFENFAAARMSAVVAATPTIGARFDKVCLKVRIVNNYPILSEFNPFKAKSSAKVICYVGGISRVRGIVELVAALEFMPGVKLLLAGKFQSESLRAELESMPGWRQVEYRGVVERKEIASIMAESSIGVVTLWPIANYLDSLPIKMFEYMAAGLPVLASDFPLWRGLVADTGAGVCVNPKDPIKISEAVASMLRDADICSGMGRAGRSLVEEKYNWSVELAGLQSLYRELGVAVGVR